MFLIIAICSCLIYFIQIYHSKAKTITPSEMITSKAGFLKPLDESIENITPSSFDVFDDIKDSMLENVLLNPNQQIGVRCEAYPRCPDCDGRGNVCSGATEFYGGIQAAVAIRSIITKCQRANALDYCGGSRVCVRKPPKEQADHKKRFGGGCYKQCSTVARCTQDNR